MAAEHSPYFSVHTQVLVLQLTAGYSTKNRDDAESHSYTGTSRNPIRSFI